MDHNSTLEKDLFTQDLKVINVGVFQFFESLISQGTDAIHVQWSPPATTRQDELEILDLLL